jgi:membrane fusion protein (multidrug efflux system)
MLTLDLSDLKHVTQDDGPAGMLLSLPPKMREGTAMPPQRSEHWSTSETATHGPQKVAWRRPTPRVAPSHSPQPGGWHLRKAALILLALAAVAVAAVKGSARLAAHLATEETDDAQVEGHISPVLPRIAGQVTEVLVRDNEIVKEGQVLARLDGRDLEARQQMAQAAVANAEAALAVARANVAAAEAARVRAAADLERHARLLANRDTPRQTYDAAKAAADTGAAQYAASLAQVQAAEAQVEQRRSDLYYATLQVSYTILTAPAAGAITKNTVEVGQFVQPGQALMAIAQEDQAWVVANFKETQVARMRVGQAVTVLVDAYPGIELSGRVESLAPNTGARLALFPPDNASGNFTKVVQRVPVRIALDGPKRSEAPLRIGMSVRARVKVS